MNGGENMSRNRFARSFAVSMVAVVSGLAIPLMHCSMKTRPSTDTGVAPSRLATETGPCVPNNSKVNPRVCVQPDGSVQPDNFSIQNKENGRPVTVKFQLDATTGTLDIRKVSCPQIAIACDGGMTCTGLTVMDTAGPCSYTPVVNNHAAADPIIVTDNCCPSTEGDHPRPKH